MNQPKFIFSAVKITLLGLFCFTLAFAQNEDGQTAQNNSSYEVTLQVVTADSVAGKNAVPASLSNVVKKLKDNYPQAEYGLASTFIQRVANEGNMQFKGILAQTAGSSEPPIFTEWYITQLKKAQNSGGSDLFQMKAFHFGQRIPIVSASLKNENGVEKPLFNYEAIGLTMQNLSFKENVPTIVGTLSTPNRNEMMFLVLTVKPAEN